MGGSSRRPEGSFTRTLIVTEFITLDGVVEAPGGEPTHPHSGWTIPYGVTELTWNATALTGDLAAAVAELKKGEGGPILVAG